MTDWTEAFGRPNLNIYQQLGETDPRPPLPPPPPPPEEVQEIQEEERELTETSFKIDQVQESAKNSLDFLAALAMPTVFKYLFPPVYLSVWQWLLTYAHKKRDFSQLALGLPRGFGKTALIKLFVLYCILFTNKKFILILGENTTKAVNIVSDVVDMLNEPNIKKVFGDWKQGVETDRQDLKKFGFRGRNIIILAGTVETIRGVTLKNERPDVMIFDDIQSRVVAESQQVSDTLYREMIGTAMKAKSPEGCLFVFIGNMYPTKWSILRRLKTNPNWIKFIAGGILADGTSLWEELQPIEQLHREFQNDLLAGHPEIFYSEVLNDENATANNTLDISKIPPYPYTDGDIAGAKFIVIDPSNDKANSDAVSIGYFEVHNGYPVLIDLTEGKLSPGDIIRESLKLAFKYGVTLIAIEATAFQYSLLYWFNFITAQMGVSGIEPVELYSGSSSKNSRILGMFLQLLKGEIWVHPKLTPQVYLQATEFNPLRRDNTDGILDLLTYAPKVIELYGNQLISSQIILEQEYGQADVQEFNAPF